MKYTDEKMINWITNYGSDKLKLLLTEETYKSDNVINFYCQESKILDKKNMVEFNEIQKAIEKRYMRYTQKQLDRLFELRNSHTNITMTGEIEKYLNMLIDEQEIYSEE